MATARPRNPQYARSYPYGTDGSAALKQTFIQPNAPTRHVVYTKAATPARRVPALVVLAAAVFIMGFFALNAFANVTAAAKRLSELETELTQIQQLNEALEVRIAESDDPSRIRSVAMNRLAMYHPGEGETRYVNKPDTRAASSAPVDIPPQAGGILNALLRFLD